MKYYSLRSHIYFLTLLFYSCNSNNGKDEPAGGPCTYETKFYPATIIAIEKIDNLNADIIFKIEDEVGQTYRDSVSWYMEKQSWISFSQIEKDSITVGKKYNYHLDRIKTGSCNPNMEMLTLEKFE